MSHSFFYDGSCHIEQLEGEKLEKAYSTAIFKVFFTNQQVEISFERFPREEGEKRRFEQSNKISLPAGETDKRGMMYVIEGGMVIFARYVFSKCLPPTYYLQNCLVHSLITPRLDRTSITTIAKGTIYFKSYRKAQCNPCHIKLVGLKKPGC